MKKLIRRGTDKVTVIFNEDGLNSRIRITKSGFVAINGKPTVGDTNFLGNTDESYRLPVQTPDMIIYRENGATPEEIVHDLSILGFDAELV